MTTEDKDNIKLKRLTELWQESRKEIRQRIAQRDRYVIQMMVGFVTVIAASRFVPGIWMLCPLPLYYYSIMTYHSYLIHKQLSFYMSEHLEKKIRALLKEQDFDYIEYESFFKLTGANVGVRKWLFFGVPLLTAIVLSAVALLLVAKKGLFSFGYYGFLTYDWQTPMYLVFLWGVTWLWFGSIRRVEKNMMSRFSKDKPSIGIIGNGEVVKKKYLPLLASTQDFRSVEVVGADKQHAGYSASALGTVIFDKVAYHTDPPDIWVVATPTPTHFDYYQLVRSLGCKVAVEKPATADLTRYLLMRGDDFNKNHSRNWFPLAYYLLEKGLPLLMLLNEDFAKDASYNKLIDIEVNWQKKDSGNLDKIRTGLGHIVTFKGVIFEGTSSNSLAHRAWVLQKNGGGNLWETLFHLTCMSAVAAEYNSRYQGSSQTLGIKSLHRFTYDIEGQVSEGDIGCFAELNAGQQLPWLIATAKGVSEMLNKREVCLTFSSGYVAVMDFSTSTLKLFTDNSRQSKVLTLSLKCERKYHTQFMLMRDWLASEENNLILPMKAYDTAMSVTAIMADYDIENNPHMRGADAAKLQRAGWSKELF